MRFFKPKWLKKRTRQAESQFQTATELALAGASPCLRTAHAPRNPQTSGKAFWIHSKRPWQLRIMGDRRGFKAAAHPQVTPR
jgi:hypothetical protein